MSPTSVLNRVHIESFDEELVAGNEYDESEEEYDSEDSNGTTLQLLIITLSLSLYVFAAVADDTLAREKSGGIFGCHLSMFIQMILRD